MIKLYKTSDPIRYWEAWITASEVTIHWGVLGDRGQTREIAIKAGENPNQIIEREAKAPRKKVSSRFRCRKLERLIIQYEIEGMGGGSDLDKRIRVEELMNECLGWKGLGHCDGGDIGSGTMNLFCFVVDAKKAVSHVVEELKATGMIDGAVVAIGEKPIVAWPEGFEGEFSI